MKKKTINIRLATLLILLLACTAAYLVFKVVRYRQDVKVLNTSINSKDQAIYAYRALIGGLETTVHETEVLRLESDRALRKSRVYSDRMKALSLRRVYVIADLELKIAFLEDSMEVVEASPSVIYPTSGTAVVEDAKPDSPTISLPASFGRETDWFLTQALINEAGMGSIHFELKSPTLDLTIGRRGVFQKSYVAAVSSPNPYLTIQKQNVVLVQKKNPTPYIIGGALGLGFVAGFILGR